MEALDAERRLHDRHRNLVVAATGTGKTVVAALDYRRLVHETYGRDLSLLFVAHRKEILEQSRRTYRETMTDGSFGEAYVGGARPERWRHVFDQGTRKDDLEPYRVQLRAELTVIFNAGSDWNIAEHAAVEVDLASMPHLRHGVDESILPYQRHDNPENRHPDHGVGRLIVDVERQAGVTLSLEGDCSITSRQPTGRRRCRAPWRRRCRR